MTAEQPLHHAATRADWARRTATHYQPSAYADEGFVHCSWEDQLVATLNRHYPGRDDLVLLTIDPDALSAELRCEDLYDRGRAFPHVYGPIELSAVISSVPLRCDDDGSFDSWSPPLGPA